MEVEFVCPKHGPVSPKNAKKGGLAVDLVCPSCGEKCESGYCGGFYPNGITKEEVYPEIYGEKK